MELVYFLGEGNIVSFYPPVTKKHITDGRRIKNLRTLDKNKINPKQQSQIHAHHASYLSKSYYLPLDKLKTTLSIIYLNNHTHTYELDKSSGAVSNL